MFGHHAGAAGNVRFNEPNPIMDPLTPLRFNTKFKTKKDTIGLCCYHVDAILDSMTHLHVPAYSCDLR